MTERICGHCKHFSISLVTDCRGEVYGWCQPPMPPGAIFQPCRVNYDTGPAMDCPLFCHRDDTEEPND